MTISDVKNKGLSCNTAFGVKLFCNKYDMQHKKNALKTFGTTKLQNTYNQPFRGSRMFFLWPKFALSP